MTQGHDLTGEELVALVQSDDYCQRLGEAARITMSTRNESGFHLYRDVPHQVDYWTPVFEGTPDEIPTSLYERWREKTLPDYPAEVAIALMAHHFHPNYDGSLELSFDDVYLMAESSTECLSRPVVSIGSVRPDGTGDLLLFQRTFDADLCTARFVADEFWAKYQAVEERWPCDEFGRLIEVPPHAVADVLRFHVPSKSDQAIVENPNVMRRFG